MNKEQNEYLAVQTETGWGQVLASFAAWCQPQPGLMTLDVGSGPGLLPVFLQRSGCQAFGVDLNFHSFRPAPLHPLMAQADVMHLPFIDEQFDLVTACNLIFLLPNPRPALEELARRARPGGRIGLINPSEKMSIKAATALADERSLIGVARDSLISWAERAEAHHRWSETETLELFAAAGLIVEKTTLKVGPGFARFTIGQRRTRD